MKLVVRHCALADEEHKRSVRQYAHAFHKEGTICVAKAFEDLPRGFQTGILLHEIGHYIAGPKGSEADATRLAESAFGVKIRFVDSPYGKRLEYVEPSGGVVRWRSKQS